MPKVSVILPVYNVEKYIDKCIQSLLNQTLKDVEFIFVDDCSPDKSVDIIKKYNDPRIKLVQHEVNKYTAEARNTGVKNATGEYIAFVDPDDYIDNNFLEELYTIAKQSNADIAKGLIRYIPSNEIGNNNARIKINKYRFNAAIWSAIYNRRLFSEPDVKFYVDTMVAQFLLVHYANKIVFSEKTAYNYVKRAGSCVNSKFDPEKWRKLNVRGANLILDFMNKLKLTSIDYNMVLRRTIFKLYQYGYNKMSSNNKALCLKELNDYLDNAYEATKNRMNNTSLLEYKDIRKKYAKDNGDNSKL